MDLHTDKRITDNQSVPEIIEYIKSRRDSIRKELDFLYDEDESVSDEDEIWYESRLNILNEILCKYNEIANG